MINIKRTTLEGGWTRIELPGIKARKFCVKNFSESDIYASLDANEEDLDHCVKIPRDTGTYIMRSESATKQKRGKHSIAACISLDERICTSCLF